MLINIIIQTNLKTLQNTKMILDNLSNNQLCDSSIVIISSF